MLGLALAPMAAGAAPVPIELGQVVEGAITEPGGEMVYALSGVPEGQRVYLQRTAGTQTNQLSWLLHDSFGRLVTSNLAALNDLGPLSLMGGDYLLTVQGKAASSTGTYTLVVHPVFDAASPLDLGAPAAGEIPTPGASHAYALALAQPETVRLFFTSVSTASAMNVRVMDAWGNERLASGNNLPAATAPITLPAGVHTVFVQSRNGGVGSYTVEARASATATGSLPLETPTPFASASASERVELSFQLPEPTRVFVDFTLTTSANAGVWQLERDDGLVVVDWGSNVADSPEPLALAAGTYTLRVESKVATPIAGTVALYAVQDTQSALSPDEIGEATLTTPGQRHRFSLEALPTGVYSLDAATTTNQSGLTWTLTDAEGRAVLPTTSSLAAVEDLALLGGDYTLEISGKGDALGQVGARLSRQVIFDEAAAFPSTLAVAIDAPARVRQFHFSAPAGRLLTIQRLASDNNSGLTYELVDAVGRAIVPRTSSLPLSTSRALAGGSYTLTVRGKAATTGTCTLELVDGGPTEFVPEGEALTLGAVAADQVVAPEVKAYTFTLAQTTRVYFDLLQGGAGLRWSALDPSGEPLFSSVLAQNTSTADRGPYTLAAGTYTVRLVDQGNSAPNFEFRVVAIDLASAPIALEEVVSASPSTPGFEHEYTLALDEPMWLFFDLQQSGAGLYWRLLDEAGDEVFARGLATSPTTHDRGPFPLAAGAYRLLVDANTDATPSYAFRVWRSEPRLEVVGALSDALPIAGAVATPGEVIEYELEVPEGTTALYVQVSQGFNNLRGWLTDPDGLELFTDLRLSIANTDDRGPFPARPGTYRLRLAPRQDSVGPYSIVVHAAALQQGGAITLDTPVSWPEVSPGATREWTLSVAEAGTRVTTSLAQTAANAWLTLEHVGSGWRVIDEAHLNSATSGNRGPFALPAGAYRLQMRAKAPSNIPNLTVHQSWDAVGPPLPIGQAQLDAIASPGSTLTRAVSPASPGDALRFEVLASASGGRWTLIDPVGTPVFDLVGASSVNSHNRGPFPLAAGEYALRFEPSGTATPTHLYRVAGPPTGPVEVPEGCAVCSALDVLFAFDTSGSMGGVNQAMCSLAADLVAAMAEQGVPVTANYWGLTATGSAPCLTSSVLAELGAEAPGAPPPGLELLDQCVAGGTPDESWALGSAIAAVRYPWKPGAARLVVPVADEGPHCGDPVGTLDYEAVQYARTIAAEQGVVLSPIFPDYVPNPVIAMAELLALGTGGVATMADFGPEALLPTATAIAGAACSVSSNEAATPQLLALSPAAGAVLPAGTPLVVSGRVVPVNALRPVLQVALDGQPAAMDAAGNFFAAVVLGPGPNTLEVRATEACGDTVYHLELTGAGDDADPWASLADVTDLLAGRFTRTTFDPTQERLLVDAHAYNPGAALKGPVLLAVSGDLHPAVSMQSTDGATPQGEPFVVVVPEGESLGAGALSAARALAFSNPERRRVDFTPRWLAPANTAPYFTSVPPTGAVVGVPWSYAPQVADADGDSVSLTLLVGPAGMALQQGVLTYAPPAAGTFDVVVRASDGRGGVAAQSFALTVREPGLGAPPLFTSVPVTQAPVGAAYAYAASAHDPDGDPLTFSLPVGPAGMTVQPASGLVSWTPAKPGQHAVVVRVSDGQGGEAEQAFTLFVGEPASAGLGPAFVSTPVTVAAVGALYRYAFDAVDLDSPTLSFALAQGPSGMTLDPIARALEWVPLPGDLGPHVITLHATDEAGHLATQSFTLTVLDALPNQPPFFVSAPPLAALVGAPWSYAPHAVDPEFEPLTFSLGAGPEGMSIDAATGLVQWTPPPGTLPAVAVSVVATDPHGATAAQSFVVQVRASNGPPVLSGAPPEVVYVGQPYTTVFTATDPDGDALAFSLAAGPPGMLLDPQVGWLSWSTVGVTPGTYAAEVRVSDGWGGEDALAFSIQVLVDDEPPSVWLVVAQQPACAGEPVTLCVQASDNVGVASRTLSVKGEALPLAGACASWTPPAPGNFEALATATDVSGLTSQQPQSVQVANCDDTEAPVVTLISPAPESVLGASTPVVVSIEDDTPEALSWTVSLRRGEDGPWQVLAEGTGPVDAGEVARFDPAGLPNDAYRLRVLASDGVQTGGIELTLHATGAHKPGRLTLALVDFALPLAGLPISLARYYDSLEAGPHGAPSELGPGWRLGLSATVQDSVRDSYGTDLVGIMGAEAFTAATRVYVTRPDGERVGFQFAPEPLNFPAVLQFKVRFEPDPGVTDTLRAVDGPDRVWSFGGTFADYIIPYNPNLYELETAEGVVYLIHERDGLLEVRGPYGDTLTVTEDGVFSDSGVALTYERDGAGRIARVREPAPEDGGAPGAVEYGYDALGNLITAQDLNGGVSTFVYAAAGWPHHLTSHLDPLGRALAVHVYDDDGRLLAFCPPDGDAATLEGCVTYAFDVAGGLTTVFDPRGFRSELFYDAQGLLSARRDWIDDERIAEQTWVYDAAGRVVEHVDAEGAVTTHGYDAQGNELFRVLPGGEQWSWEYGSCRGESTRQCDPLGNCWSKQLDEACRVTHVEDPLGGVTEAVYDARGLRTALIDPQGQTITTDWSPSGRPTGFTDASSGALQMTYNAAQRVASIVDRDGRVRTFAYDEGHRLTKEVWLGEGPTGSSSIDWTYDAAHFVSRVEWADGALDLTYWPTGRTRRVAYTPTSGPAWWVEYDYDGGGNTTRVTDSTGAVTHYEYDGLNHLVRLWQTGDGVAPKRVDFEVSSSGLPLALARFGDLEAMVPGPTTTYSYGCASCPSRLEGIHHLAPDGAELASQTFTRNAAHQIVALADAEGAHGFVYDGRGWLVSATSPPALPASGGDLTWDGAGNWLTRTAGEGQAASLSYQGAGGGHRLLADGAHVYTYGHSGQLLTRQHLGTGETLSLAWDPWERLTGATLTDEQGATLSQAAYAYAPYGWRLHAEVDGERRHYLYDGPNAIAALDDAGQVVWRRLHPRAVDRPLAEEHAGEVRWLLSDHVGSVRDVVTTQGDVLAHFAYDPFGRQLLGPEPTLDDAVRFTGREFDVPGGLGYFRARIYDPAAARFVSEDSEQPWHYRYAENNPLSLVDPSGRLAAIEYAMMACDALSNVSFALGMGKAARIAFEGAADAVQGKGVDGQAIARAVLKAIADTLATMPVPCGLDMLFGD